MPNPKQIKVTLRRSTIGRLVSHKACVRGLGLRRLGQTRILEDTPAIRGMINKVAYMVSVEDHEAYRVETRSRPRPRPRPAGHPGYIWERDGWPAFTFTIEKLNALIEQAYTKRTVLRMRFDALKLEEDKREQIAKEVSGLERSPGEPEGVAAMMCDATQNYRTPITQNRLCDWHKALFPDGRADGQDIITGAYRDDRKGAMVVESGYYGKEKLHFEAPAAPVVEGEMQRLLTWIERNAKECPALAPAIAHLWLLTIHPFDNANGRLARAVTEMLVSRLEGSAERLYCIASQIHAKRSDYDFQIEWTQKGELDITNWLEWFLKTEIAAIEQADTDLTYAIRRMQFWDRNPEEQLNARQVKVMKKVLQNDFQGKLTAKKWTKMAKCSAQAATADIEELINRGALCESPEPKREPSYTVPGDG